MRETTQKESKMKVAVVQEPPVYLDLAASMARAVEIVAQSANDGAKLVG
jgi:nitrilase